MWRDDAYLLDMLLAARKVLKYAQGYDFRRFEENEVLQDELCAASR